MSQDPIRSDAAAGIPAASGALGELAREIRAALLYLTGREPRPDDRQRVARGGAAFPALGFVLAAPIALVLWALDPSVPPPARGLLGAALLWVASRGTLPRALGRVTQVATGALDDRTKVLAALDPATPAAPAVGLLAAVLLVKAASLTVLGGSTLGLAVVLAVVLGRWAMAVHVYGSLSAHPDDLAATFVRKLEFNQFAVASVTAMAVTLAFSNAMGVLLLFGVASVTIAFRIGVHGWLGGIVPPTIRAAGELAETTVLVLCALLVLVARALGG